MTNIVKHLPKSRKVRVIINGISFYSTVNQIRSGIGDFYTVNAATQKSLDALEYIRSGTGVADQCTIGIAGIWENMNVQLNLM